LTENSLITKITDIIIEKTVKQKIPTVVFMSVRKEDLVKNLFWTLKSGNKDESTFTQEDWKQVAEIMKQLSDIPLLLKETTDVNYIKTETQTFITGMDGRKGLVIIHSKENISEKDFIQKDNISVIVIN
jgi:replicative DNA helicase